MIVIVFLIDPTDRLIDSLIHSSEDERRKKDVVVVAANQSSSDA